jgi:hypothetical protein
MFTLSTLALKNSNNCIHRSFVVSFVMGGHTVYYALCCAPIHEHDSWGDFHCGSDDGSDSACDIVDKEWMGEFVIIARDLETQE